MNRRMSIKSPFGPKSLVLGVALIVALLLGLVAVSLAATGGPAAIDGPHTVYQVVRVDAGLPLAPAAPLGKSTVGDYVWFDTNYDGIQDPTEVGVNGVLVNLYLDTMAMASLDRGDVLDGTTTTATNAGLPGWYEFPATGPNTYWVQIDPSNFTGTGPLVGYVQTNSSPSLTQTNLHKAVLPGTIDYVDADFGYARASILVARHPTCSRWC